MFPNLVTSSRIEYDLPLWNSCTNVHKGLFLLNTDGNVFRQHVSNTAKNKLVEIRDSQLKNDNRATELSTISGLVKSFEECGPFSCRAIATIKAIEKELNETSLMRKQTFSSHTKKPGLLQPVIRKTLSNKPKRNGLLKPIDKHVSKSASCTKSCFFYASAGSNKTNESARRFSLDSSRTDKSHSSEDTHHSVDVWNGDSLSANQSDMKEIALRFKPSQPLSLDLLRNNLSKRQGELASAERKMLLQSIDKKLKRDKDQICADKIKHTNVEKLCVENLKTRRKSSKRGSFARVRKSLASHAALVDDEKKIAEYPKDYGQPETN